MLQQTVIFFIFSVICVCSMCDQRCLRQYTRVKRGRFYSYPQKFYNLPPSPFPVSGAYSNTPPPMISYEPHYTGSRPYKVSKRPSRPINDGLGDDDITNLVKHLSKEDLDKILEFAQEKDQGYSKYKDIYNTNEYTRPYKRESKILYKGNKYEEPTIYKQPKPVNYVTESTGFSVQETLNPSWINSETKFERNPFESESHFAPDERIPNDDERPAPNNINSKIPVSFFGSNSQISKPNYVKVEVQPNHEAQGAFVQFDVETNPSIQSYNSQEPSNIQLSINPYFTESDEESKLPRPLNMRDEDFDVSYTNNVPKVISPSSSYDIENFGDLPLMDYTNSKLGDVSSYHVPHYIVTQPKPVKNIAAPISYSSPYSSSLLKPSPASSAIKAPVYEPAPPKSAAVEQSDAHLKATKIWSHKSKGAAYTLHDDGTLTPERTRPKYG